VHRCLNLTDPLSRFLEKDLAHFTLCVKVFFPTLSASQAIHIQWQSTIVAVDFHSSLISVQYRCIAELVLFPILKE
jgi:hypothetical protein